MSLIPRASSSQTQTPTRSLRAEGTSPSRIAERSRATSLSGPRTGSLRPSLFNSGISSNGSDSSPGRTRLPSEPSAGQSPRNISSTSVVSRKPSFTSLSSTSTSDASSLPKSRTSRSRTASTPLTTSPSTSPSTSSLSKPTSPSTRHPTSLPGLSTSTRTPLARQSSVKRKPVPPASPQSPLEPTATERTSKATSLPAPRQTRSLPRLSVTSADAPTPSDSLVGKSSTSQPSTPSASRASVKRTVSSTVVTTTPVPAAVKPGLSQPSTPSASRVTPRRPSSSTVQRSTPAKPSSTASNAATKRPASSTVQSSPSSSSTTPVRSRIPSMSNASSSSLPKRAPSSPPSQTTPKSSGATRTPTLSNPAPSLRSPVRSPAGTAGRKNSTPSSPPPVDGLRIRKSSTPRSPPPSSPPIHLHGPIPEKVPISTETIAELPEVATVPSASSSMASRNRTPPTVPRSLPSTPSKTTVVSSPSVSPPRTSSSRTHTRAGSASSAESRTSISKSIDMLSLRSKPAMPESISPPTTSILSRRDRPSLSIDRPADERQSRSRKVVEGLMGSRSRSKTRSPSRDRESRRYGSRERSSTERMLSEDHSRRPPLPPLPGTRDPPGNSFESERVFVTTALSGLDSVSAPSLAIGEGIRSGSSSGDPISRGRDSVSPAGSARDKEREKRSRNVLRRRPSQKEREARTPTTPGFKVSSHIKTPSGSPAPPASPMQDSLPTVIPATAVPSTPIYEAHRKQKTEISFRSTPSSPNSLPSSLLPLPKTSIPFPSEHNEGILQARRGVLNSSLNARERVDSSTSSVSKGSSAGSFAGMSRAGSTTSDASGDFVAWNKRRTVGMGFDVIEQLAKQQASEKCGPSGEESNKPTPRVLSTQPEQTMRESADATPYYTVLGSSTGKVIAVGSPEDTWPFDSQEYFWDIRSDYQRRPKSLKSSGNSIGGGALGKSLSRKVSERWNKKPGSEGRDESPDIYAGRPSLQERRTEPMRSREGDGPHYQTTTRRRESLRLSLDKNAGSPVEQHSSTLGSVLAHSTRSGTSTSGSSLPSPKLMSNNYPRSRKSEPVGLGGSSKIWKLVKRISTGGLRDKYQDYQTSSEPPPVPALPKNVHQLGKVGGPRSNDGHGQRSRRPTDADQDMKTKFMQSRPSLTADEGRQKQSDLSLPRPLPFVPVPGSGPRPSTTTISSSASSDAPSKFSSQKASTHSAASSISSYEADPNAPPLPYVPQHIVPPSELYKMHINSSIGVTVVDSVDLKPKTRNVLGTQTLESPTGEGWTVVRSPVEERPSLPFPPRRTQSFGRRSETGEIGRPSSPTIPAFSVVAPINTFNPSSKKNSPTSETQTKTPVLDLSAPPRPARSSSRPSPTSSTASSRVTSPTMGSKPSLESGSSKSTSRGRGTRNLPSVPRRRSGSFGQASFRELPAVPAQYPLTEQEKAEKWDDLLQRSAQAGGTIHLATGALESDRLSGDIFGI